MEPELDIPPSNDRLDNIKSILSTLLILISAPLVALLLTIYVFQSYQVDGPSMETTLQNNDRLIVVKLRQSWAKLTHKPYIPERGTIVVFVKHDMYEFGSAKEKQLIKRVIGLPGERVVVKDGTVTVYNPDRPNGFNPDKEVSSNSGIAPETGGSIDLTVPENEIFVMGDNRPNSLDSRSFGPVPAHDLVGTLGVRILPLSGQHTF